jgi:hypothetical protein
MVGVLAVLATVSFGFGGTPSRAAPPAPLTLFVNPDTGRDSNPGTQAQPLRTLTAAWNKVPADQTLTRRYLIKLSAGTFQRTQTPNYWENRLGTYAGQITIQGPASGKAFLPSTNVFNTGGLTFDHVTFKDRYDLFHCELCSNLTLSNSAFLGSQRLHENIKINQSRDVVIRNSRVRGADDNSIDMVAVRNAEISNNRISGAGDWCLYAKGGSADVTVAGNRIFDCGTGGVTAGQGTGLQFMVEPFIHYEAYRVRILNNDISDIYGAAIGVNGGYQVTIAGNRAYDVGSRSHMIEITYGLRSCDGRPGDEGRERCQQLLDDGAWGTTRVDDGTNAVRIPNRHVAILGNVIDNPRRQGDQLFYLADPYSGASQDGSGLGAVRADVDLRVAGNRIAGRGLPSGLPSGFNAGNDFGAAPGQFNDPVAGRRLVPRQPMPAFTAPSFADDAPTPAED